jgi:uridine kinase
MTIIGSVDPVLGSSAGGEAKAMPHQSAKPDAAKALEPSRSICPVDVILPYLGRYGRSISFRLLQEVRFSGAPQRNEVAQALVCLTRPDMHSTAEEGIRGEVAKAVSMILDARSRVPVDRSVLAAVSGIDASGKGYLASLMVADLLRKGVQAVAVNVDGWLNLPEVRFSRVRQGEHFYRHALRLDEMFDRLILPLQQTRRHRLDSDFAEETATAYRRHIYDYRDVDVIVLEGIFLLKAQYRRIYDLSFWVACTFETALERALARQQEGLPPEETVRAYHEIYFPAQWVHFALDAPWAAATAILRNDPRLKA